MDGTKETKILNPATEDPVARRAVTQLFHKACPDTTMVCYNDRIVQKCVI